MNFEFCSTVFAIGRLMFFNMSLNTGYVRDLNICEMNGTR